MDSLGCKLSMDFTYFYVTNNRDQLCCLKREAEIHSPKKTHIPLLLRGITFLKLIANDKDRT